MKNPKQDRGIRVRAGAAGIRMLLQQRRHGNCRNLARAMFKIMNHDLTEMEREAIQKIDIQSSKLYSSREPIRLVTGYNVPREEYGESLKEVVQTVGEVSSISSVSKPWAIILFRIIRELRPLTCFEMGTNVGISAAYQAYALQLNMQGRLITFELSSSKLAVAEKVFADLGLSNVETVCGDFQCTLKNHLEVHKPIDYIFIDGHHDGDATLEYFGYIAPYLSDGAVLIFDDIKWSADMLKAWNQLKRDRRLPVAIGLNRMGICIFSRH